MCSLGIIEMKKSYISDELNSEESINKILSDGYFTSKNLKDILTHELTHKNIGTMQKKHYNDIEEAKNDLDSQLVSYIKNRVSLDRKYLSNICQNIKVAYSNNNNINKLVAEVMVLGDNVEDKELLNKVKEVLDGNNDTT